MATEATAVLRPNSGSGAGLTGIRQFKVPVQTRVQARMSRLALPRSPTVSKRVAAGPANCKHRGPARPKQGAHLDDRQGLLVFGTPLTDEHVAANLAAKRETQQCLLTRIREVPDLRASAFLRHAPGQLPPAQLASRTHNPFRRGPRCRC